MFFTFLCIPALIYFIFMMVHVIVSTYDKNYNEALLKLLVGTLITLLLQVVCMRGMTLVSWIIVLIPFIFYTYMIIVIGHVFGINPSIDSEKKYEV